MGGYVRSWGWGFVLLLLSQSARGVGVPERSMTEAEAMQVAERAVSTRWIQTQGERSSELAFRAEIQPGQVGTVLSYRPKLEDAPGGGSFPELERSVRGELLEASFLGVEGGRLELRVRDSRRIAIRYEWDAPGQRSKFKKTFFSDDLKGSDERSAVGSVHGMRSRLTPLDSFQLEPFPLSSARALSASEKQAWVGQRVLTLPKVLEAELKRRGLSWRVPEDAQWFEAEDFFGRPLLAIWVSGEPWPRYLRGALGVSLWLEKLSERGRS